MVTRVDLSNFSLARLKRPTPKTPHRERIAYIILSPVQVLLWPILCLNLSLFVTDKISSQHRKPTIQCKNVGPYETTYGKCGAKISRLLLT